MMQMYMLSFGIYQSIAAVGARSFCALQVFMLSPNGYQVFEAHPSVLYTGVLVL